MNFADLPVHALIQALNFTPALVFECAFLLPRVGSAPFAYATERLQAVRDTQADSPIKTVIALEEDEFDAAAALVGERYATRSYLREFADWMLGRDDDLRWRRGYFTLVAYESARPIGTVTLGFDSGAGIFAEETNAPEVAALRARGRRLCEMIRLAVEPSAPSKRTLAALFNAAYGLGRAHSATDLLIEVNPRHVLFYTRSLGFEILAAERICQRVGAPSVLLRLDLDVLSRRIENLQAALEDVPL